MSTAKLNIWVTKMGDPCRIEDTVPHFVYVLHCNGDILEWCGKKYVGLPTKCGELEIEIPPGCYIVGAVRWARIKGLSGFELGNVLSHIGIVRANCGDHVCVTLFEPSLHCCGSWLGAAINTHVASGGGGGGGPALPPDVISAMQTAKAAVDKMLKLIPPDPFAEKTAALAVPPQSGQPGAPKGKSKKR